MRTTLAGLLVLSFVACGSGETAESQDPTSQRSRDSAVAASSLPGAEGVQGAMSVADSAAARRAREDSIAREQ
jgi:hypothetical protein